MTCGLRLCSDGSTTSVRRLMRRVRCVEMNIKSPYRSVSCKKQKLIISSSRSRSLRSRHSHAYHAQAVPAHRSLGGHQDTSGPTLRCSPGGGLCRGVPHRKAASALIPGPRRRGVVFPEVLRRAQVVGDDQDRTTSQHRFRPPGHP